MRQWLHALGPIPDGQRELHGYFDKESHGTPTD
ncbi:MAG: hypothetical protein ACI8Y4_005668, partial [Candidatus Poriferisodalaceae bacterium]